MLVNPCWNDCYPNAEAEFFPAGISDHSPAIFNLGLPIPVLRKPFRFFNFLAAHPCFATSVEDAWEGHIEGSPLYQLCRKLKKVKEAMRTLNHSAYNNLPTRAALARQRLLDLQTQLQVLPM